MIAGEEWGDDRWAWIVRDRVLLMGNTGDDEPTGDFGVLLGGAAGIELDGANRKLGTPPCTPVVARSENHAQLCLLRPVETPFHHPVMCGAENARVRAALLSFEAAGGGGVFTTGSIPNRFRRRPWSW